MTSWIFVGFGNFARGLDDYFWGGIKKKKRKARSGSWLRVAANGTSPDVSGSLAFKIWIEESKLCSSRDSPFLCLHRLAINLQSECIHMLNYWLHTTFRLLWMALLSTCVMSVLRLKSCSVDFWSFWSEELSRYIEVDPTLLTSQKLFSPERSN